MPKLEMRKISKLFPGVVALDNVDFELESEVHILLGENGAGKSTLVKILSGAYQKTSGEIYLNGKQIEIKNPKHAQELGIGIIYQELNLVPHLTAAQNIYLGREPFWVPGMIDRKKMINDSQILLNDLGVDIQANQPVSELSIAQQQMVEVAKALSLRANILIMDEPTSALTGHEIKELFATIKRLVKKGVSVIYISHRIEELFKIGDRVTILRDGKYISTHPISAITEDELVQKMVNRKLTEHFPKQKAKIGEKVLCLENINVPGKLFDINFSLYKGEILGISGLMGSGRTELARTIFGVENIASGRITVKGKPVKIKNPRNAINLDIGFLTEDRKSQGLILNLSVKENICLPSVDRFSNFGLVNQKKEIRAAEKYIREMRIKTPGMHQKVIYLSGGNQQKVIISKWLCTNVDILIFDEPTRGIDVGSKVEIYELMNQLTAHRVAILMISSELPEILGMSDRILVMREGRIAGEFTSTEATQEKIMNKALRG